MSNTTGNKNVLYKSKRSKVELGTDGEEIVISIDGTIVAIIHPNDKYATLQATMNVFEPAMQRHVNKKEYYALRYSFTLSENKEVAQD